MTTFEDIYRQVTRDHCELMGYPVPQSLQAGQSADIPVAWGENVLIPVRLLKPDDSSIAQRYIGREICSDTRSYDEAEIRRAYNRKGD